MIKQKNASEVLRKVADAIEILGPNGTVKVLRRAASIAQPIDALHLRVINCIRAYFGLSETQFYKKESRGQTKIGVKLAAFLLYEIFNSPYEDICICLRRNKSNISRYIKEIHCLNPEVPPDAEMMRHLENLRERLEIKYLTEKFKS